MPASRKDIIAALKRNPWVDEFGADGCLFNILVQAVIAQGEARQAVRERGGNAHPLTNGDKILEQVKTGRVSGDKACLRAADALRQYDEAYMSAERRRSKGHTMPRHKAKA